MYALETIVKMNKKPLVNTENEVTRHCSFHGDEKGGIVLHSAKQRSTKFLRGGRSAKVFLQAYWSTNSVDRRDEIIEGYFA